MTQLAITCTTHEVGLDLSSSKVVQDLFDIKEVGEDTGGVVAGIGEITGTEGGKDGSSNSIAATTAKGQL